MVQEPIIEGRSCPEERHTAMAEVESLRAISVEITSSTKLCCMSAGSDSLASDNHTLAGRRGGGIKPVSFVYMYRFIQV